MSESSTNEQNKTTEGVPSFYAFLRILERSMDHPLALEHLCDDWPELSEMVLCDTCLESYSEFLQTFSVKYQEPPGVTKLRAKAPSDIVAAIEEFSTHLSAVESERTERHGNRYSWFESSWFMADFLEEAFPEELNPGTIIAEYLELLFPKGNLLYGNKIIGDYHPPREIVHGSPLHAIVAQIGETCLEQVDVPDKTRSCLRFALRTFLNPDQPFTLPEGVTLDDVIRATILSAPESFFVCWARGWWLLESPGGYNAPISPANVKTLLSLVTLKGGREVGVVPRYGSRDYLTLNLFFDLTFRMELESVELDQELVEMFRANFDAFTSIRRNIFCGVSPYAAQPFHDFYFSCMPDPLSAMDLTFMLDHGKWEFGRLYLCAESEDPQTIQEEFNEKQQYYIRLFDACVEEGLPELGNALLSLYLFARALTCHGRFPIGGDLGRAIEAGARMPGGKVVKHTIVTIVDEIEKNFSSDTMAALSAKYLKQFAPQKAQLLALDGARDARARRANTSEKEVRDYFCEKLGGERWEKLSRESQEHLVSAEVSFRQTSPELGFGIKDCSGFTISCCKAFEKELGDRLRPFYFSDSYLTFLKEQNAERLKHPTFGSLVNLLDQYGSFSPELRQELDSRLRIQHHSKIVKALKEIVNLRNRAAHQGFDTIHHAKFKKLVFQDEVLHRFIDTMDA